MKIVIVTCKCGTQFEAPVKGSFGPRRQWCDKCTKKKMWARDMSFGSRV